MPEVKIYLPAETIAWLDSNKQNFGYTSRSPFVKHLVDAFIRKNQLRVAETKDQPTTGSD